MIIKKRQIPFDGHRAQHVYKLVRYITCTERSDETLLLIGGANFIFDDEQTRQHELVALASESVRSPNPVTLWLMSWREGEEPDAQQVEQAVHVLLEELGMREHQVIWTMHRNTNPTVNVYAHILVNRVHPESYEVATQWQDFKAAARAIAKIEHLQGWQDEPGALFAFDGQVFQQRPNRAKRRSTS